MYRAIAPGAIGVGLSFEECVPLAAELGFHGIYIHPPAVEERGVSETMEFLARYNMRAAGYGLPVQMYKDDGAFEESLKQLPAWAATARQLDCGRCSTWVPPASDDLDFDANYARCKARLARVGAVLKDYDAWLGLEFIGPKTCRDGRAHEFIHTMKGMLELCEDAGTGNIGLLLDCWHWYTSGGTIEEIEALRPEQVVNVHVNDAPAGIPVDEQIDNVRETPGATGVIDLKGFLDALRAIGYTGPVMAEPFSKKLAQMDDREAMKLIADSLALVG